MHLSASFAEKNSAAVDTSNGMCRRSGATETTYMSQVVYSLLEVSGAAAAELTWISDAAVIQAHLLTSANNMTARGRTLSSSEVKAGPNVSICSGYKSLLCYGTYACGGRT